MRTLRILFSIIFTVGIVAGVTFLIGREVLLYVASVQVTNMIDRMESAAIRSGEYSTQCQIKSGNSRSVAVTQIQTRFINDQEFIGEVLCELKTNEPIIFHEQKFPPFVTKVPGEAGLIWDEMGRSGIAITAFGRYKTIILDGTKRVVQEGLRPIEGNQPVGQCTDFGYFCCDAVTEIGDGASLSSVTDCHQNCYESCRPRPVVLRFYSDPAPDIRTREVLMGKSAIVSFFYVIDPGASKTTTGTIDFGDGQTQAVTEVEGIVQHTYTCNQPSCEFTATLQAQDELGNSSIITPVATLKLIAR